MNNKKAINRTIHTNKQSHRNKEKGRHTVTYFSNIGTMIFHVSVLFCTQSMRHGRPVSETMADQPGMGGGLTGDTHPSNATGFKTGQSHCLRNDCYPNQTNWTLEAGISILVSVSVRHTTAIYFTHPES